MKSLLYSVIIISLFSYSCVQLSPVVQGGGSEVEVVGTAYFENGEEASYTQVKLIPVDYDAASMESIPDSMLDTSDAHGRYSFRGVEPGSYNIQAVHLSKRTRFLLTGITVSDDTVFAPSGILHKPGSIRLLLPETKISSDDYVNIPGTDIAAFTKGEEEVILDSVPAGIIPQIRYINDGSVVFTKFNVTVLSDDTITIANPLWKYSHPVFLNTSRSGADIKGDVYNFPVLVRLDKANFDFSQAKPDGSDIRFTKSDYSTLEHEIEHWDQSSYQAEIWVRVDTLFGNDSLQWIMMYWGNEDAQDRSNAAAVFDTASGFQGVWHLAGDQNEYDATANSYDGVAYGMAEEAVGGIIGKARPFDGTSSYIKIPNTANSKLNFPENGTYSVSAWVNLDTLDLAYRTIISKGYYQYYMRVTCMLTDKPLWEFVEFDQSLNWKSSTVPATAKQWVYLTGVKKGSSQYLFCNGELVDSVTTDYPNMLSRNTSSDISIGGFLDEVTFPTAEGYCFFKGKIDEVRIQNTACSEDWVRLCYMNQRSDNRLVVFQSH